MANEGLKVEAERFETAFKMPVKYNRGDYVVLLVNY